MSAGSSGSTLSMFKSPFVLKTLAFVAGLYVLGYVAPMLMDPQSSFTGITVGISWSLATLILAVGAIMLVGAAVRSAVE
jgi:hypothetical protein